MLNPESKTIEVGSHQRFDETKCEQPEKLHLPWQEIHNKDVIDDVEMKKKCINHVSQFFDECKDLDFVEEGLEGRCKIALQFYDTIKQEMGISTKLRFDPTMPPKLMGEHNRLTNTITLNANLLETPDCKDLMETILHESRHAYQKRCVDYPKLSTVRDNVKAAWKENFDQYIRPEDDFVAYENQEIEKDANYFASTVMRDGMNKSNYA